MVITSTEGIALWLVLFAGFAGFPWALGIASGTFAAFLFDMPDKVTAGLTGFLLGSLTPVAVILTIAIDQSFERSTFFREGWELSAVSWCATGASTSLAFLTVRWMAMRRRAGDERRPEDTDLDGPGNDSGPAL